MRRLHKSLEPSGAGRQGFPEGTLVMSSHVATYLTIEQKLAAGGLIGLRTEFCPWAGICPTTAYKEIGEGRLKVVKVGRSTKVAGADAFAWRDSLRRGITA
jgi:hypothetical protein